MDNIKTKILIGGAIVLVLFAGINIVTLFVEPREGIEEGIIEETVSEDVIVVEEPETVSEDEIIIEGPPFESEEITLIANSGEEYKVLVPEYKNPYVEKIRKKANIPADVYPNSSIIKLESGDFAWYYDGNGGETKIYNLANLSAASTEEFLTEFAEHTAEYIEMVETGKAPKIDLDDDGQITFAEIELAAIYITYTPGCKAYVGGFSMENKVDREVWW